ncbi:hypothetical protein AB6A40_005305 [Gnathostoma spinigerum]|uniref:Uncharacterized protein n=1 Tax=Gnathostoma spinigerum TaxID=75299 RepID=A0ABD6EMD9_9BILA
MFQREESFSRSRPLFKWMQMKNIWTSQNNMNRIKQNGKGFISIERKSGHQFSIDPNSHFEVTLTVLVADSPHRPIKNV